MEGGISNGAGIERTRCALINIVIRKALGDHRELRVFKGEWGDDVGRHCAQSRMAKRPAARSLRQSAKKRKRF